MDPVVDNLVLLGGKKKMALLPVFYTKQKLLKEENGNWVCIALKNLLLLE
jgi:hypothetical protein